MSAIPETSATGLKLDLGCGNSKKDDFLGIDRRKFPGVEGVTDLTAKTWLFDEPMIGGIRLIPVTLGDRKAFKLPDNCVAEVHCSHFLEHLEHNQRAPERVRFMNEMWRVMIPGAKATIITPHWTSHRAYGDFTHADKPVSEMFYPYLDKDWRWSNAPDNDIAYNPDGYDCDFSAQLAHTIHPMFEGKSQEEKTFAVSWYKEAVVELTARLVARK